MSLYNFIFTKQRPACYYRHIAFWTGRFLFSMFCFGYLFLRELWNWNNLSNELIFNSFNLALAIVYCYIVVYYIYPAYLNKNKYLKFFSLIFLLTIITYAIFYWVISVLWDLNAQPVETRMVQIWNFSIYFITAGPPVVCCLFLQLKCSKTIIFKLRREQCLIKKPPMPNCNC